MFERSFYDGAVEVIILILDGVAVGVEDNRFFIMIIVFFTGFRFA